MRLGVHGDGHEGKCMGGGRAEEHEGKFIWKCLGKDMRFDTCRIAGRGP